MLSLHHIKRYAVFGLNALSNALCWLMLELTLLMLWAMVTGTLYIAFCLALLHVPALFTPVGQLAAFLTASVMAIGLIYLWQRPPVDPDAIVTVRGKRKRKPLTWRYVLAMLRPSRPTFNS